MDQFAATFGVACPASGTSNSPECWCEAVFCAGSLLVLILANVLRDCGRIQAVQAETGERSHKLFKCARLQFQLAHGSLVGHDSGNCWQSLSAGETFCRETALKLFASCVFSPDRFMR